MNRAAVNIPEKLFFKIGEVCEITDVQAHVLRYWESEFPMLAPQKNRAGQRTYRKRDVEMVLRIKELLYEDQYTIAGAKKKLVSELRGASKLKVVSPEMNGAANSVAPPAAESQGLSSPLQPLSPAPSSGAPDGAGPASTYRPAFDPRSNSDHPAADLSDDKRAALRRLRGELYELLRLLDAAES
ncbi:MAG: MerR family transcriptional regulator [Pyrinomonadaceae bacterium]